MVSICCRVALSSALIFALACGGGSSDPACAGDSELCGDVCVSINTDNANCGACGNVCAAGEVCNGAGACELSCQSGMMDCDGTCVDPNTDRGYCGATGDCVAANAGTTCGDGEVCNGAGTCELSCQSGMIDCDGTCVDPNTDRGYCGATGDCVAANAGMTCGDGEICNGAGVCELSCQSGQLSCSGTCVDPNTDRSYCGATGDCIAANAGTNCGDGEVCNGAGTCELSCQTGLLDCAGTCVDPNTDRGYCGATADCIATNAGTSCGDGEVCNGAGTCELSCQTGLLDCAGTCVDPSSNPNYCGATGDCLAGNAGAVCTATSEACSNGVCLSVCNQAPQTYNLSGSVATWEMPAGCVGATIEAGGGSGGENISLIGQDLSGAGAVMIGDFVLATGTNLDIIVGGRGTDATTGNAGNGGGGGGGGSFVRVSGASTPLLVAGGGGGSSLTNNGIPHYYGKPGVITNDGSGSRSHDQFTNSPGGIGGADGTSVSGSGGKGWNGIWADPAGVTACSYGGNGGYGGGGGSGCGPNLCNLIHTAGGGGGYSGGGAGGNCYYFGGGGGGSYNDGTNPSNTEGANRGDGYVTITPF